MPMADDLGNVRAALAELTDIELGALIATANGLADFVRVDQALRWTTSTNTYAESR